MDEATMALILKTSGGDMRKAVTCLQSCRQLCGDAPITADVVIDISGQVVTSTNLDEKLKLCSCVIC